jgi:hypothetical protein
MLDCEKRSEAGQVKLPSSVVRLPARLDKGVIKGRHDRVVCSFALRSPSPFAVWCRLEIPGRSWISLSQWVGKSPESDLGREPVSLPPIQ